MNKIFYLTMFVLSTTIFSSCFLFKPQRMETDGKPLKVSEVFGNVVDQFRKAKDAIDEQYPSGRVGAHHIELIEADVVFDNVVADEGDVSLSILVFKPGYTRTKTKETTVTYSLTEVPAAPGPHVRVQAKNQDALKDLIVASVNQFIAVAVPTTDDKKFVYEKDIEIDVSFKLDQNGNIEVTGPIGNFTPDVKLSRDVANTHTVKVKFVIDKKS